MHAVAVGVLQFLGMCVAPVLLMGAFLHAEELATGGRRLARRLHLLRPAPPEALGPPLEQLAADLRRLYPLAHYPQPGVRRAKHRGIVQAYDAHLVTTARTLELATTLADLTEDSFDREAERLRLEHALTRAGLSWQV